LANDRAWAPATMRRDYASCGSSILTEVSWLKQILG
jgi:hypothetical protein